MVSREFIYSNVKSRQVISVYMKGEDRLDRLTLLIYVIRDLILDKKEEQLLLKNLRDKIDTDGVMRIIATRTSEIDYSLIDNDEKEYVINTADIVSYESRDK